MKKLRFSFPRFWMVLQNDLRVFARPVLLATLALLPLMVVLYLVQVQDVLEHGTVPPFFREWFGTLLMIGGFLLSSFAFFELAHKEKGMAFLMVPASQLEKWLSRVLITGPVFALYFWLVFGLIGYAAQGISAIIFGAQLDPYEWIGGSTWLLIRLYLVFQALFVSGSLFLGKLSIIKTPVVLGIVGAVFVGLTYVYVRLLMWDISEPGWELEPVSGYRSTADFRHFMDTTLVSILELLFWWTLAPFFWVVSYVRLTEKEV